MSGYLTQLLRSTFDPSAGMVQPRVNALFSPPEKVSAWRADQSSAHEPQATSERNGNDADAAIPGLSLERPLTHSTNPTPADEEDSIQDERLPPAISFGPAVAAHGEAERSQSRPVRSAPTKIAMREGPDSPQPETSQVDDASQGLRITAKPLREKMAPFAAGSKDDREENPSSFAHAEPRSAKREIGTFAVDPQPQAFPEESPKARARLATARAQVPVQPGPPDATASGILPRDVRDTNSPIPKENGRKTLPAVPLSPVENSVITKHAESRSAELNFGRNALSAGPNFRELGRRESQAAPLAESTIEVTIGRIEVRSGAPAAPQRTSTPLSRGPNLEEYLRRRSGRSRE